MSQAEALLMILCLLVRTDFIAGPCPVENLALQHFAQVTPALLNRVRVLVSIRG